VAAAICHDGLVGSLNPTTARGFVGRQGSTQRPSPQRDCQLGSRPGKTARRFHRHARPAGRLRIDANRFNGTPNGRRPRSPAATRWESWSEPAGQAQRHRRAGLVVDRTLPNGSAARLEQPGQQFGRGGGVGVEDIGNAAVERRFR